MIWFDVYNGPGQQTIKKLIDRVAPELKNIVKPLENIGFSMFFTSGDLLSINFFIVRCNGRLLTSNESISDDVFTSEKLNIVIK